MPLTLWALLLAAAAAISVLSLRALKRRAHNSRVTASRRKLAVQQVALDRLDCAALEHALVASSSGGRFEPDGERSFEPTLP